MPLSALATPDHAAAFGYDSATVAPMLMRASVRVRGYLSGRASAARALAEGATVPDALAELVCAIANRMAATPDEVVMGARSESSEPIQVTWGAEAYAGVSDLTPSEKRALNQLFPRRSRCIDPTTVDS